MNYKIHLLYIYDKQPPTCVQMMGAECVKFVTHTCLIQKCPIWFSKPSIKPGADPEFEVKAGASFRQGVWTGILQ